MPVTYEEVGLVVGGTYALTLRARKDGITWDISGATVTLYLRDPDGNWTSHSATVTDGPAGIASYTTLEADLSQEGDWARYWKVSLAGVVLRTCLIEFSVCAAEAE